MDESHGDGSLGDEALLIARGVASAVAPEGGLAAVQISLLGEIHSALTGVAIDFADLDPLGPAELADSLGTRTPGFRHRVVQDMVLGELILRPIPPEVARRVETYARALRVDDRFVRIARRYAQGAFGLAWLDLHRSGFAEHWERARMDQLKTTVRLEDQLAAGVEDEALARTMDGLRPARSGHARPGGMGDVSQSRIRASGIDRGRLRVPRPARLRARARRLRHQSQWRARGVRPDRARQTPIPRASRGWRPSSGCSRPGMWRMQASSRGI